MCHVFAENVTCSVRPLPKANLHGRMFPPSVNHAIAWLMFLGYDASWADVPARRQPCDSMVDGLKEMIHLGGRSRAAVYVPREEKQ